MGIRRLRRHGALTAWLCLAAIAGAVLPVRTSRADITGDQVKIAVDKAIKHIKSTQAADGSWQDFGRRNGVTALNVLAMLAAGVPESDAAVRKGIAALDATPNTDTYVVALKAMVYRYADPVKYKKQLSEAAEWLVEAQLPSGTWSYGSMRARGGVAGNMIGDNSNTQFGLLGLHECANGGIKIPKEVWKRSEEYFVKSQCKDGSWGYSFNPGRTGGYGSMTCTGIANLYITGNRLDVSQEAGYMDGVAKNCGHYRQNDAIAGGLKWLARNFTVETNPSPAGGGWGSWRMYYLYAMERVGMISGLKFFGTHDWYREGAEALVKIQAADGSWREQPWDNAFALLFLAKGNKPVLVNKLQWGQMGDWNPDHNDIEHLIKFVNAADNGAQKFSEQQLAWQVVNLRAPLVDLLDAPLLYFNGHTFPDLAEHEVEKLKEFVDQGGTILIEACCSKKEFIDGFHNFAKTAWPDYPIERLPDDHPIFSSFYALGKNEWNLEGLQVGCRTSVIFAPKDLSCLWEQADPKIGLTEPAMRIGTNIAAYATGLERLKDKLERARVAEKEQELGKPGDIVRGALHIGALAHAASPLENMTDPNALPKFAEFLRDQAKIDVIPKLAIIDPKDPELLNHPIMYMTGHVGFDYSEEQLKAVRTWLDRGGFLYADSCCGRDPGAYKLPGDPPLSNDFGSSFRKMVKQLYPAAELAELPPEHPIRGSAKGYFPLAQVNYRPEIQKKLLTANPNTAHDLHLAGVTVNGRLVIVYSPYGITCGLEDHKCFGCRGLLAKDAYRVSTNVILYALSN